MVSTRTLDAFIGRPHSPSHYDCADLALDVAREIFGRHIALPAASARPRPHSAAHQALRLRVAMGQLATPIEQPFDGALVLMRLRGQRLAGHIGTYIYHDHAAHVLHTSVALGYAALHPIQALARYGMAVEGYYQWCAP